MDVASDGKVMVTGDDDGVVRVQDADSWELLAKFTGHTDDVSGRVCVQQCGACKLLHTIISIAWLCSD